MIEKGGRNKLAAAIGVSGPYLGRVLSGKKPMTEELIERMGPYAKDTGNEFLKKRT